MNFASLHAHTQYSPLDSIASAEEYVSRASEVGIGAIAVTDHGRVSGHRELQRACKDTDIKPILGIEAYFSPTDRFDRRTKANRQDGTSIYDHLIVLAKNENGLRNLNNLSADAWNTGFYQQPRIDKELLTKYHEDLIISSACMSGPIAKPLRQGDEETAYSRAEWFKELFGDDFYIEVMTENGSELNKQLLLLADTLGIKPILTEDSHYVRPEDLWVEEAFLAISTRPKFIKGRSVKDIDTDDFIEKFNHLYGDDVEARMTFQNFDLYMAGRERREQLMAEQGIDRSALYDNTVEIADKIGEYPYFENLNLFPSPGTSNPQRELEKLCREGMTKCNLAGQEYEDLLAYELGVIKDKDFASYFLIVSDIMTWCKRKGIRVGFGRGSSAGSLVGYVTEITGVDPLEYGLLFERFLDPSRTDIPDVDLDVQANRRGEIKTYLQNKYGNVASIATQNMFKEKNSLKEAASVLGISYTESNKVLRELDADNAFDQYRKTSFHQNHLDVYTLAKKFEGKIRNSGMHPGGIILSTEPVQNYAPIETTKVPGQDIRQPLVAFDAEEAEKVGFVKIDLLGVKILTVVDDCLKTIASGGKSINMFDIPTDDPAVYEMLSNGFTKGVFQAEGPAFHRWIMEVGVKEFNDLVIGTSIARPGAMNTVGESYKKRLRGQEKIEYVHPIMEQYLSKTLGCIVFQESLMQMVVALAGMTMEEANKVRRITAKKKDPELLKEYKDKFISGACEKVTKAQATKLWKDIEAHAGYSFNKSHSVAYSLLTNVTAWLKYYYPIEYMHALLSNESDKDARTNYLLEAKRLGIKILLPDVNKSEKDFSIEPGGIRFGLTNIKYISDKTVVPLLKNRPFTSYKQIEELAFEKGSGLNTRVVQSLCKVNAIPFDNPYQTSDWRDNLYEYLDIPADPDISLPTKILNQFMSSTDYDEDEPAIFMGMVRNIKRAEGYARVEMLDPEGTVSFFTDPKEPLEIGNSYVALLSKKRAQKYIDLKEFKPTNDHPIINFLKFEKPICEEAVYYVLSYNSRRTKAGKRMATITYADRDKKLYTCEVWPSDWASAMTRCPAGAFVSFETELKDDGTRFYVR